MYDSVVQLDREEWRSASYGELEADDDRPTRAEAARDDADRPVHLVPDAPYRCTDPWCHTRVVTPAHVQAHAAEGCTACAAGKLCTFLQLQSQEPHLHGVRPDGVRV